jgi:hypothetical protein
MRKMRTRARRLRIGPTSRPSDLVCLLFSRPNCDAASNFAQAYSHRYRQSIASKRTDRQTAPRRGDVATSPVRRLGDYLLQELELRLSDSPRRTPLAAELANIKHGQVGGGHDRQKLEKKHLVSEEEAAELLKVSRSSVQAAKRKKRKAEPTNQRKPKQVDKLAPEYVHKRFGMFLRHWTHEQQRTVRKLLGEYLK